MPPKPGSHINKRGGFIDANFKKNLAELETHPSLMERCKKFFTARVIYKLSLAQLASQEGVCIATAKAYVDAYKATLLKYWENEGVEEPIWFLEAQIARLIQLIARSESVQEKAMLEREARNSLGMLNELRGLVDRRPQVNINILTNQVVNVVSEEFPKALQEFVGQPLTTELADKVMALAGERIIKRMGGGG